MSCSCRSLRRLLPIAGTLIFFLLVQTAISYIVCSSFFRIFIDARFEQQERVQVFYGVRPHFTEERTKRTAPYSAGLRETKTVDINNHVARHLRIDLGDHPGSVHLYGLRLTSFYFPDKYFSAQELMERSIPGPDVTLQLNGDSIVVESRGNDPYILLQGGLRYRSLFFTWVLPLLLSLCFFLFLSSFEITKLPAIADVLQQRQPSTGGHFAVLDGIRGLAALTVLAEHVGIMANGIGVIGVYLFFSLSGFLLALPFVRQPERAISLAYMRHYMLRRLKRIIPMYYTMITILFFFRHKNPDVFRHYLFLQGDGYLWTVPQEMFFYTLLPFVVCIVFVLMQIHRGLALSLLLAAIVGATCLSHQGVITLYGNGLRQPVLVGVFLSGMFFSYLYHFFQEQGFWHRERGRLCRRLLALAGFLGLVFMLVVASRQIAWLHRLDIYQNYGYSGFLAAFIIFAVVSAPQSLLARSMALAPLRAVGVIAFSFYLLHPTCIVFCDVVAEYYFNLDLQPISRFFISGALSYCLAAITYSCIERPFMKTETASAGQPA